MRKLFVVLLLVMLAVAACNNAETPEGKFTLDVKALTITVGETASITITELPRKSSTRNFLGNQRYFSS